MVIDLLHEYCKIGIYQKCDFRWEKFSSWTSFCNVLVYLQANDTAKATRPLKQCRHWSKDDGRNAVGVARLLRNSMPFLVEQHDA